MIIIARSSQMQQQLEWVQQSISSSLVCVRTHTTLASTHSRCISAASNCGHYNALLALNQCITNSKRLAACGVHVYLAPKAYNSIAHIWTKNKNKRQQLFIILENLEVGWKSTQSTNKLFWADLNWIPNIYLNFFSFKMYPKSKEL